MEAQALEQRNKVHLETARQALKNNNRCLNHQLVMRDERPMVVTIQLLPGCTDFGRVLFVRGLECTYDYSSGKWIARVEAQ